MMLICVGNLTIIGSDNGLSPGRRQAITWTNVGILLIEPLWTNFSEMLIEIHTFSFKKIHLKMSSGKWRPFYLGLNVLTDIDMVITVLKKSRILTLNVRGPSYLGLTRSISWLLMPWLLTSPGHQQPWYWLCRLCRLCLTKIDETQESGYLKKVKRKPGIFQIFDKNHHFSKIRRNCDTTSKFHDTLCWWYIGLWLKVLIKSWKVLNFKMFVTNMHRFDMEIYK